MSPAGRADLEELLGRFEAAWRRGESPRLEEYFPSARPNGDRQSREALTELIKIDLEYRWCQRHMPGQVVRAAGTATGADRPCLEDYVRRFPDLGPLARVPVELIGEEYRARAWSGNAPSHPEFLARFAAQAPALRELLKRIDAELASESAAGLPSPAAIGIPATPAPVARPLPSVEDLLDVLRATRLLSAERLKTLVVDRGRGGLPDARGLGRHLLEKGWLTPYQVNQLILGRGYDLVLGSYVLLERLGDSFKGQVCKAYQQPMNRFVVLKLIRKELLADPETVRRFYREVQAAGRVSHPHVVHAFDAGPIGATHFLAMEYVDGIDLAELVKQSGPLPTAVACEYVRQAALGLAAIQEYKLVHRDIKPSNLIVTPRPTAAGEVGLVKILDLGLALLQRPSDPRVTETLTQEGAVMGTPDFMAPEQAEDPHSVDVRADLYSLGCTLHFLLTGQVLFPGTSLLQKLDRHRWQEPAPLEQLRSDVPAGVAAIVRKLIAKRPEDRYQEPAQVAAALAEQAAGLPKAAFTTAAPLRLLPVSPAINAIRPTPLNGFLPQPHAGAAAPPDWLRKPRRRRWLVPGAALMLLGLLGLFLLFRSPGAGAPDTVSAAPAVLDKLRKEAIPTKELFPWQPPELVAVLGEHSWRHWGSVHAIACSPNGQWVASGGDDRIVRLEDPAAKEKSILFLEGRHSAAIRALAFAPGGRTLVSAGDDASVRFWDVAAGKNLAVFHGHKGPVQAVAFAPDGQTIASGGKDGSIRLWNVATEQERSNLPGKSPVTALAYVSGGQALLAACEDGSLRVLDLAGKEPRERAPVDTRGGKATALGVAADGKSFVCSHSNGTVSVGVLAGPDAKIQTSVKGPYGPQYGVALSANGQLLALGGHSAVVQLWDLSKPEPRLRSELRGALGPITSLAFLPDGKVLAAAGQDQTVRLWDIGTGEPKERALSGHTDRIGAVAFSPDSKTLASGGTDRTVRLWDLTGPREKAVLKDLRSPLAFAAGGKLLVTAHRDHSDGSAPVWDLGGTQPVLRDKLKGHRWLVQSLVVAADGQTVATGSGDGTVRLWDLFGLDGKERAMLPGHVETVPCLAFAPDGSLLATTASKESTVRLWRLGGAKPEEWTALQGASGTVQAVAFAPDSRIIAAAGSDRIVHLWDLTAAAPKELAPLKVHTERVNALAFTPDGRALVSAAENGRVVFADLASRQRTHDWLMPGPVCSLALTADGRYLALGNGNGTVYVCRMPDWGGPTGPRGTAMTQPRKP